MQAVESKMKAGKSSVPRRLLGSVLALALGSSLASACSAPIECNPPIPAGAVYKVTLTSETPNSDGCHIVKAMLISPFMLTVGKAEATNVDPSCKNSPAAGAPTQTDVLIQSCLPSESDMLGVYCQIQYRSSCEGAMSFYFQNPPGASVDWTSNVIDGAIFRVQDFAARCLPDLANCTDEYTARLERMF
jgi:hypothetical protein